VRRAAALALAPLWEPRLRKAITRFLLAGEPPPRGGAGLPQLLMQS